MLSSSMIIVDKTFSLIMVIWYHFNFNDAKNVMAENVSEGDFTSSVDFASSAGRR